MSRSLKKGPHVDLRLLAKVEKQGMNKDPINVGVDHHRQEFIGRRYVRGAFHQVCVTEDMSNTSSASSRRGRSRATPAARSRLRSHGGGFKYKECQCRWSAPE